MKKETGTITVGDKTFEATMVTLEPDLQKKDVTITENKTTKIEADSEYDGLEEVNVTTEVQGGIDPSGANAQPSDVAYGKTFYAGNEIEKTGTLEEYEGATTITTNGTLATNNKIMRNDLTINISGGGGSGAKIRCAEMPNVTLTLSQNGTDIESKTTPATIGGIVDFEVSAIGTYTITATGTGITTWTHNVEVTELGTITECKAGVLANYTELQMHTALQGGYFSKMFSVEDEFTISAVGSILNNSKIVVEWIEKTQNNKEIAHFRTLNSFGEGTLSYAINERKAVMANSTGVWNVNIRSLGGFKYSDIMPLFLKTGDEIYSFPAGLYPDAAGTMSYGTSFSQLKYTNGNSCPVYAYNCDTDTLTQVSSIGYNQNSYTNYTLIKGYYKSVGEIDEATFNAGVYYTKNNVSQSSTPNYGFTKVSSYSAGTTYYGLYETIQENGVFIDALLDTAFAPYLVKFTERAGTGRSITNSFSLYCDIPALEEIWGINSSTILPSGVQANAAGFSNISGEGAKKGLSNKYYVAAPQTYWTRSAPSSPSSQIYCVMNFIQPTTLTSYSTTGIRLGFRIE